MLNNLKLNSGNVGDNINIDDLVKSIDNTNSIPKPKKSKGKKKKKAKKTKDDEWETASD